jgi:two-component system, OmpR family, sensor kinase
MDAPTPFRAAHAPSILRRLNGSAIAIVLLSSALGAIVAATTVSEMVRHLVQSSLEEAAQVLVVLAEHEEALHAIGHDRVLPAAPHREVLVWQLRRSDGSLVLRSHDAPAEAWDAPLVEGHQESGNLALFTQAGQGHWLQVAQPLGHLRRAQRTAALRAGGAVLALGLIAAAIMAWRLRAELHPLRRMARDVEAINPGPTATTLPRSPRFELEPVYAALEHLLQRLAEKLRIERAFAAQAAHSLRTPLAGLAAQLEVARLSAPADLRPRLDQALSAARRLNGVVSGLLALGRATGPVDWQPFDARELARVALGGGVDVDASGLNAAPRLNGNLDLLGVAVANLVDNAARHGAACARLSAHAADGMQWIRVSDDGPGVPPERLRMLRDGLSRLAEHGEAEGSVGLGLTLAATVARVHGGRVDLDCKLDDNAGFCVQIVWPSTPPGRANSAA